MQLAAWDAFLSACGVMALSFAALTTARAAASPTLTFGASPTFIQPGAATKVTWASTHTTHCTASGAWGGKLPVGGAREVVLYKSGTLYLTCKGADGQVQKELGITVAGVTPPSPNRPNVTLSASPNSVAAGGRTALTWSSSNATACVASGEWSGSRATAGNESSSVLSSASSAFTLTCTGPGGQASSTATVAVAAGAPSTGSYSSTFDRDETPLSEGGAWRRANNDFTHVRTVGGAAFGTNGVTNTYDDSYALLTGFGPNQTIEAVVQRAASLNPNVTHEVELLLRFADSASGARGYECLFAFYGGVQIVRWNGTQGNYTVLQSTAGSENLGRGLVTGDVIKADMTGNVISLYVNGILLARAADAAYTTGQPGIGFFTRPGGNSAHLALTKITATSK